jgi:hypothetical protein
MADLSMVYRQFATADPAVGGLAGNWSDNCEKLRGTIRELDDYMTIAASLRSHRVEIPPAARPAVGS